MPSGIPKNGINEGWFKKNNKPWNTNTKGLMPVPWNKGKEGLKREKNPSWKGGKMIGSDGHIMILMSEHPFSSNNGYIREHRLIMEKHIGRYLNSNEIVHHLLLSLMKCDGDVTNNQIDNLHLFDSIKGHLGYHKFLRNCVREILTWQEN